MKTVRDRYIAVKRSMLEDIAGPASFDRESVIKEALIIAGPENADYAIVKVIGVVQALVETKFTGGAGGKI